jgi:hypothetical protein
MNRRPYRYPGEKFVGFATRQQDKTLKHNDRRVAAVRAIPNNGLRTAEGKVSEVLTDKALLKERSLHFHVLIEAVVVLARSDT